MAADVHHISLRVSNARRLLKDLVDKFHFSLFTERVEETAKQFAVRSGSAIFVVNERAAGEEGEVIQTGLCNNVSGVTSENTRNCSSGGCHHLYDFSDIDTPVDSVCNVAFEVEDVDSTLERVVRAGGRVLTDIKVTEDEQGSVTHAVVQSPIGNVVHTLLDKKLYKGLFLPGFEATNGASRMQESTVRLSHFDHVTYACPMGSSPPILEWYERCLGLNRFLVNRDESEDQGFIVQGTDVGMRLKAFEYWKCAKEGLNMPGSSSDVKPKVKFVIAEPLPGQGPNQVETFLEQHGGPGIQHIGLHTPDIVSSTRQLRAAHVQLLKPPDTYYSEIGKLSEIHQVGQSLTALKDNGVLLDAEADATDNDHWNNNQRYLMQVFTKPIFDEDTFFLEIIQRCGATGFGAGNITALWRSVQAYLDQREQQEKSKNKSS
ncbi:4-hydroxyphenylpyruvate dioxygenase-like protein [Branchiostoma lanceolatum]|uniref:4-hydroxyphenylpyruvate dioxygenase-like protein n=1 Tax=Branchiostoma lanceolatum TaxID=7740 RepID=UPI003453317A